MPAPIRPSPTIPNCTLGDLDGCAHRLADLDETLRDIPYLHAQHTPPVIAQRLEIAERLRLLEHPKGERLPRNLDVVDVIANDLQENPGVWAAFMELPG